MNIPAAQWRLRPVESTAAEAVAADGSLPVPVARAIAARGITAGAGLQSYLSGSLSSLSDPFGWPDLEKAVDRVWKAIDKHERISVFGDYDADGVTAAALMLRVLRALGAEITVYLPCRFNDGYGLHPESIRRCIDEGRPDLIITVDCGSSGQAAVDLARNEGIDVIVTDHHAAPEGLPDAYAVINPVVQLAMSAAPPAGVGVAFKFCHGLVKRGRECGRPVAEALDLREHLGLVALGTVADVVPLLGENRILVKAALKCFPAAGEWGLHALAQVAGLRSVTTAEQIAFGLAPRLNAGGRLAHARQAFDLLLADDLETARAAAGELHSLNEERRGIEKRIINDAAKEIAKAYPDEGWGLVVAGDGWHRGVIGIVAARLCNQFCRPAAVVALDDEGCGHGSARSFGDLNLVEILEQCADLLSAYGGHTNAAGFSLEATQVPAFARRFNDLCRERFSGEVPSPVVDFDAWIDVVAVNERTAAALDMMGPFGEGNPAPLFGLRGVPVRDLRRMGTDDKHARWVLGNVGSGCKAVMFNAPRDDFEGKQVDVLAQIVRNTFRGVDSIELHVKDIRF